MNPGEEHWPIDLSIKVAAHRSIDIWASGEMERPIDRRRTNGDDAG
jgi:hypothetical protein